MASPVPTLLRALAAAALVLSPACAADPPDRDARTETVIYGDDDRREWFEHPDAALRALSRDAVVALLAPALIEERDGGPLRFAARTVEDLCPTERFLDQPVSAVCSATLIDEDLLVTAGHCVPTVEACRRSWYAFDYFLVDEDELGEVAEEDVYFCRDLLVVADGLDDGDVDYGVVQLDRPVSADRIPVRVRTDDTDPTGLAVSMSGFPLGLPMKLDSGGTLVDAGGSGRRLFEATVDAYGGNSGSGVFDEDLALTGILSGGNEDFVTSGGCSESNVLDEGTRPAELSTYAARAVEALCATGYPSLALCGVAPTCGDGWCTSDEDTVGCAEDCQGTCGDEVCQPGEALGDCPDDCWVRPPPPPGGWSCPPEWYGAVDGCDCGCGVQDLDCEAGDQPVFGCEGGSGPAMCVDGRCTSGGGGDFRPRRKKRGCAAGGSVPPGGVPSLLLGLVVLARRRG